jgi:hypothetical protein
METELSWLPDHKHDYTYDAANLETLIVHSEWNIYTSEWDSSEAFFSFYDANVNLNRYLAVAWNADSTSWINQSMDTYNL